MHVVEIRIKFDQLDELEKCMRILEIENKSNEEDGERRVDVVLQNEETTLVIKLISSDLVRLRAISNSILRMLRSVVRISEELSQDN